MNRQTDFWQGAFGDEYTRRNTVDLDLLYKTTFGISRSDLNKEILSGIAVETPILEAGCNQGLQLALLRKQGFSNLWGIDINKSALQMAKSEIKNNIVEGSILDIPYKNNFFGVVFTSGVLIHIHPDDIKTALSEIHRTTKRFIWGFEYYSKTYQEIPYRGHSERLWKADYSQLFLDQFSDLRLIAKKEVPYLQETGKKDVMYLLEKKR